MKLLLTPDSKHSEKELNLKQVTEILQQFGLAKNVSGVQRLTREQKIRTTWAKTEDDRKNGKIVIESELYRYVTTAMPAIKIIFEEMKIVKK